MTYRILVRRLLLRKERYISAKELKEESMRLNLRYEDALAYLYRNKYIARILRGFFYVPSAEERRLKTLGPNPMDAIGKAMKHKGIKNWYFGLETAIKLNNITHEYFHVDYVVSDTFFRPRPIVILGRKVKFVKLKKNLFGFGIRKINDVPFSDMEKTILDLIYVRRYAGKTEKAIHDELVEWAENASKNTLKKYATHYSTTVRRIAEAIL